MVVVLCFHIEYHTVPSNIIHSLPEGTNICHDKITTILCTLYADNKSSIVNKLRNSYVRDSLEKQANVFFKQNNQCLYSIHMQVIDKNSHQLKAEFVGFN